VYGTNVYENGEEKQEQSVVVDEGEEEEDKIQHFQPKVRKEDVWREIIITSVGRDKAFVSFFCFDSWIWYFRSCLCRRAKETDTILDSSLSVFPFLVIHKSTPAQNTSAAMGKRVYQATHINSKWTIFHKVYIPLCKIV
jgi:hypothetical protein